MSADMNQVHLYGYKGRSVYFTLYTKSQKQHTPELQLLDLSALPNPSRLCARKDVQARIPPPYGLFSDSAMLLPQFLWLYLVAEN